MTKTFTPEFTDRAGAIAYVKAGRKGLTRPTKDAWNTRVDLVAATGATDYDALLVHHEKVLLKFYLDPTTKREEIEVVASGVDHPARKRINDYALNPRGLELYPDLTMQGPIGTAVGNRGSEVPISGRMGSVSGVCFIEDDNQVRGLHAVAAHWPERRTIAKAWADAMVRSLTETTWDEDLSSPYCIDCSPIARFLPSVARLTGDREHVFAHIFGQQYNPSLFRFHIGLSEASLNTHTIGSVVTIGKVTDPTHLAYIRKHLVAFAIETLK